MLKATTLLILRTSQKRAKLLQLRTGLSRTINNCRRANLVTFNSVEHVERALNQQAGHCCNMKLPFLRFANDEDGKKQLDKDLAGQEPLCFLQ